MWFNPHFISLQSSWHRTTVRSWILLSIRSLHTPVTGMAFSPELSSSSHQSKHQAVRHLPWEALLDSLKANYSLPFWVLFFNTVVISSTFFATCPTKRFLTRLPGIFFEVKDYACILMSFTHTITYAMDREHSKCLHVIISMFYLSTVLQKTETAYCLNTSNLENTASFYFDAYKRQQRCPYFPREKTKTFRIEWFPKAPIIT